MINFLVFNDDGRGSGEIMQIGRAVDMAMAEEMASATPGTMLRFHGDAPDAAAHRVEYGRVVPKGMQTRRAQKRAKEADGLTTNLRRVLKDTDYTQGADMEPAKQRAFATYRSELRALLAEVTDGRDPATVTLPDRPARPYT